MNNPPCVVCGKPVISFDEGDPRVCEACWRCPECGVRSHYRNRLGFLEYGLLIEIESGKKEVVCYKCSILGSWTPKQFERAVIKARKKK